MTTKEDFNQIKRDLVDRVGTVETAINSMDKSIQEVKAVLFGEKGEKGVVGKLTEMVTLAEDIKGYIGWIFKILLGSLLLAALPSMANFINMITHIK